MHACNLGSSRIIIFIFLLSVMFCLFIIYFICLVSFHHFVFIYLCCGVPHSYNFSCVSRAFPAWSSTFCRHNYYVCKWPCPRGRCGVRFLLVSLFVGSCSNRLTWLRVFQICISVYRNTYIFSWAWKYRSLCMSQIIGKKNNWYLRYTNSVPPTQNCKMTEK